MMSDLNFSLLSSQDFEELARDLLQAEWDVALEAFRSGRDRGIDLRYAPADGGTTVIQCKHYAKSGFNKLLSHLRLIERPKIERLDPKRYVVVTSVGLTPPNKDLIVQALSPFVLGVQDIFGADDLAGLLSRHPNVERAHFKLWLTSTSVLERVLHNAEHCQTDFEVDRIRRKLPLFVQTAAYPRALELLDKTRIVVISGVPGIGKTTLAETLLYSHLERGYQPVVIQAEVAEGKKLFRPEAKQIFYYDDFLGQTFLGDRREYLGRNQDVAIVDFIEMVRQSEHSIFILTTREHILSNALQISEKLAQSPILEHQCILELGDYSFGQKARILYNHLYFSDLPQPYKNAILVDDFFLEIIRHDHFTPRLIEWLASYNRLRNVSPKDYRAHVSALLDSPESIWTNAFQHQISDAARHALLCLYTLGEWIETRDFEPVFRSLHRHSAEKYQLRIAPGDFRSALRELDGAFFSYSKDHISYLNPSVREFIGRLISSDHEIAEDLLKSAVRFRQLADLWRLSSENSKGELREFLTSNIDLFCTCLSKLLDGPSLRWEKTSAREQRGYYIDMNMESRIVFLAEVSESQHSAPLAKLATQTADNLIKRWDQSGINFGSVIRALEKVRENAWFLSHGGSELYRGLLNGMLQELSIARAEENFPGRLPV